MTQKIVSLNNLDENGNPTGGTATGTGINIKWQNGPLGRGHKRSEANGAFVEGVLEAAKQRLEHYQSTKFKCRENQQALHHLELAMLWLEHRTLAREQRQVEGTHNV